MVDRLFFSTEGLDWGDDAAIEAFAQRVWDQATAAFTEDDPQPEQTEDTDPDQGEPRD